jgi:hypothetical protein
MHVGGRLALGVDPPLLREPASVEDVAAQKQHDTDNQYQRSIHFSDLPIILSICQWYY